MALGFGFPAKTKVAIEHDGQTETIDRWGQAHVAKPAYGGRVNVYDEHITNPTKGKAIVRDDGKTTVTLVGEPAAQTIVADLPNNRKIALEASVQRQGRGWATGDYYMLETDPVTGDIIYEPGRNHRKIYVTSKAHGLTAAMIAQQAGVDESVVTVAWLKANPTWGATPDKALAKTLGLNFWGWMTNVQTSDLAANPEAVYSYWLLLERGGDYEGHQWGGNQGFFARGVVGESFLHPTLILDYGDPDEPAPLVDYIYTAHTRAAHNVAEGTAFLGARGLRMRKRGSIAGSFNIGASAHVIGEMLDLYRGTYTLQSTTEGNANLPHCTLYRCKGFESSNDVPAEGLDEWVPLKNHTQGVYASDLASLLVWKTVIDKSGWRDGFSSTSIKAADGPHPPSMYTHGFYIQYNNWDTCLEENIVARASSLGTQDRSSGQHSMNLLLDNNVAGNQMGGNATGTFLQYGFWHKQVVTSAGMKVGPLNVGGLEWGFEAGGKDISAIDNVCMHKADPNNSTEVAAKGNMPSPAIVADDIRNVYFDNTRISNWGSQPGNEAQYGLTSAMLKDITIQKYAEAHPGVTGTTVADYMAYWRTLPFREHEVELDRVMRFFQEPWGLYVPPHTTPGERIFLPSDKGEGFRFDNRLNWPDGCIPIDGDTLDLDGNNVLFGRYTRTFKAIKAGGSRMTVSSGKVTVEEYIQTNHVEVRTSGQFFSPGGTGTDYTVSNGRLCLTKPTTGAVAVSGRAEALLGPDLTIPAGKELVITGARCWVGWDRTGTATLTGAVAFIAQDGKIGKLQRFKRRDDDPVPTVTATVNLTGLRIDATGLTPGPYDLTGPGITVTDQGATLPAGVSVTAGKLVLVVS